LPPFLNRGRAYTFSTSVGWRETMPSSLAPRHAAETPCVQKRRESVPRLPEECWRQHTIDEFAGFAARDWPQVGAGPEELVYLRQHDPRSRRIQPQVPLQIGGNFDRCILVGGRRMADGNDRDDCPSAYDAPCHDNGAR